MHNFILRKKKTIALIKVYEQSSEGFLDNKWLLQNNIVVS